MMAHDAEFFWNVIYISIKVAILSTVINIPPAVILGWVVAKKDFSGKFIVELAISLPLVLPPVVIGYLLLILMGREGPLGKLSSSLFGVDLVFTWVAAAVAASIVSFPLIVRAIVVAMKSVDPKLARSARSLGAGAARTFFTVTLPIAYQGVLAGVLLGFVRALGEFGATIIVAGNIPGRTQTLPQAIFGKVMLGKNEQAFQLITASVGLAIISILIHNWLLGKARR